MFDPRGPVYAEPEIVHQEGTYEDPIAPELVVTLDDDRYVSSSEAVEVTRSVTVGGPGPDVVLDDDSYVALGN